MPKEEQNVFVDLSMLRKGADVGGSATLAAIIGFLTFVGVRSLTSTLWAQIVSASGAGLAVALLLVRANYLRWEQHGLLLRVHRESCAAAAAGASAATAAKSAADTAAVAFAIATAASKADGVESEPDETEDAEEAEENEPPAQGNGKGLKSEVQAPAEA